MSAHTCRSRACLLAILATASLGARQSSTPAATAFTNAVVIDGTGGPVMENATIVVRGPIVEAVGPAGDVAVPADARLVDLAGKSILPGLADMHVHLTGGWDGDTSDLLGYRRYLNSLLYSGITTVLDTGNVLPYVIQLRAEVAAGRLMGPRIYCAGPLVDGPDPLWPPLSYTMSSVDQAPGIVRQLKAQGVDIIKGYIGLSHAMVAALAAEGRKQGLALLLDQTWRNGSAEFAAAGAGAFAHTPDFITGDDTLTLLRQRNVKFISTLAIVESKARRRFDDLTFLDEPLIRNTTPRAVLEEVRAYKPDASWEKGPKQSNERRFSQQKANLKRLFDAGILVAAGTDAACPGVFHGEGLHRELELLVEAGLPPLAAIAAATGNAARFIGAEKEWGTLAPGKTADLVIVDGRPDRVIGDTRRIVTVVRRGEMLDRDRLAYDPKADAGFRPVCRVAR